MPFCQQKEVFFNMSGFLKDLSFHWAHYIILVTILFIGIVMFYIMRFHSSLQVSVLIMTSFAYILWGVIHHWLEDDFHLKVLVEYFVIAVLADILIITLLFRA